MNFLRIEIVVKRWQVNRPTQTAEEKRQQWREFFGFINPTAKKKCRIFNLKNYTKGFRAWEH